MKQTSSRLCFSLSVAGGLTCSIAALETKSAGMRGMPAAIGGDSIRNGSAPAQLRGFMKSRAPLTVSPTADG